jgi:hypothetical protein
LVGVQQNEEVIAAYASAWESGAIDAAVANGSMAYELSLHHIAGFLFGKDSATEDCVQSKVAVSIVRSSMRKPEQVRNISRPPPALVGIALQLQQIENVHPSCANLLMLQPSNCMYVCIFHRKCC